MLLHPNRDRWSKIYVYAFLAFLAFFMVVGFIHNLNILFFIVSYNINHSMKTKSMWLR
jgi:hypothetical protein